MHSVLVYGRQHDPLIQYKLKFVISVPLVSTIMIKNMPLKTVSSSTLPQSAILVRESGSFTPVTEQLSVKHRRINRKESLSSALNYV